MLHSMNHGSKSMKLLLAGLSFAALVSAAAISAAANSEPAGNKAHAETSIASQSYTETDISEDSALLSEHWDAMEYASTLQAELRSEYPEEFLGLYMHDNRRVQLVVLWSRDAQIPEPLLDDSRVLVERGDFSEKELSAIQLSVAKDLRSQGLSVSSYTDFMHQRVVLQVPATKYEAVLQFIDAQKQSHLTASGESDYSEVLVVERVDAEPTTTAESFARGPWFAANKAVGITSGSAGSSSSGFFGVGMSVSYFSPYVVSVG